MAPRHEILAEGVELWCGDMLDILPTLGEFDACVTDPPYGINENDRKVASRGNLAAPKDYGAFDWDSAPASAACVAAMRACSRHQIIFGGNYFDLPPSSCWLVWDKQNGENDFADCELAWTNMRKAVRRVYWRWNGMIRKGHEDREHPTQKPLGVMLWCIDQLPADVGTILDPFMGSGTTGVAAIKRGKAFYGIEREPKYFDVACSRISDALKAPDMFVPAPAPKPVQEPLL